MVGGDGFLEEEEGVGYGLMGGCGWSWIACIRILGVLPADFWDCEGLGSVKWWTRIVRPIKPKVLWTDKGIQYRGIECSTRWVEVSITASKGLESENVRPRRPLVAANGIRAWLS